MLLQGGYPSRPAKSPPILRMRLPNALELYASKEDVRSQQGCRDVTVPYRTDKSERNSTSLGRRPITLAQLPHIGSTIDAPVASTTRKVTNPPPPTPQPSVDWEEETPDRLDINPPEPNRFRVDPPEVSHLRFDAVSTIQDQDSVEVAEASPRRQPQTSSPREEPSFSRRGSLETRESSLYHLHQALAPHAGLLATLVLVASAGFLYWLIIQPETLPQNLYEENGHFPVQQSQKYTAAELPQPGLTTLPTVAPKPVQQAAPSLLPEVAKPTYSNAFPTTSHPSALDFSKLGGAVEQGQVAEPSESYLQVGERPGFESNSPVIQR